MKIGIVTQPLWGNYGGILQNYALQRILQSMGHEAITFDHMCGHSGFRYVIAQCKVLAAYFLGRCSTWRVNYAPKRNNPLMAKFVIDNIKTTNPFWNRYRKSLIHDYNIEAVIVGSDQVWRPMYNPYLEDMYLVFCKKSKLVKRIAYAASFGTSDWEYNSSQQLRCADLLNQFDAVSVREPSGIAHLKKLGINNGIAVLDPTLVYGRQGFDILLDSDAVGACNSRCLGTYILEINDSLRSKLHDFSKRFGYERTVTMQEDSRTVGVTDWIQTIKNSNLFITDSFHGLVFCIIYHVPFYVILNNVRGNDRINSLLSTVGLVNRVIDDLSSVESIDYEIDWDWVDSIIDSLRMRSIDFLTRNLKVN